MRTSAVVVTLGAALALAAGACGSGGGTAGRPASTASSTAAPSDFHGVTIDKGRTRDGRYLAEINSDTFAVSDEPWGSPATTAQTAAVGELVTATRTTITARWSDYEAAVRAGYKRVDPYHYVNAAYIDDGLTLDPQKPESLMYVDRDGGRKELVGAMYLMPGRAHGPQPGGPLTVWHYHLFPEPACFVDGGFPVHLADAEGRCDVGVPGRQSPEMLHVWIDNPRGPFDPDMYVPPGAGVAPLTPGGH